MTGRPHGMGEVEAAEALRESYMEEKQQIAMTEGSRLVLQAMLREEVPIAVAEGLKQVMTPETARMFADVFIEAMKQQASLKVDTWAGSVVKTTFKKAWEHAWLIVFAIGFAYSVGGFGAVAGVIKWSIREMMK